MSRYCLDTSAYSHFKRGDPAVVDLIDRADWLGLPSIALGEIWIGFLLGNCQKARISRAVSSSARISRARSRSSTGTSTSIL